MNKNIIENEYFPIFGDIFPFFTKQSQLLQEYDEVRIECYRELTKLPEINDNNGHDYDHRADTLIVTYKDIVIGGGKVVGKFPGDQHLIPLDDSELNLEKQFKDFNLDQVPYCEFTRMSILKPFRSPKLLHAISNELILYSIAKGYKYMFSVSSLAQARCNRRSAKVLGLPFEYNIHTNMEVPNHNNKYGDLKVVISSLEFPSHWKGIKTHSIKIY